MKKFIAIGLGFTGLAYLGCQLYNLWKKSEEEDETKSNEAMVEEVEFVEVEFEEDNHLLNFDVEVNYHLYRNRRYYPTLNFNRELELIEEDDYWDDLDVDFEEFF
ncbi:CLUMA_CG004412, isoform A [Clunio marinus]|uniref:CLUMA_CG004412, isoform A n=1 Tax=Clunio marinus TaxID=568069 RepID=A0A1J1HRN7_9DIPT|nr:CLUMA_CG004412, isoform A [Clunio marinus]